MKCMVSETQAGGSARAVDVMLELAKKLCNGKVAVGELYKERDALLAASGATPRSRKQGARTEKASLAEQAKKDMRNAENGGDDQDEEEGEDAEDASARAAETDEDKDSDESQESSSDSDSDKNSHESHDLFS